MTALTARYLVDTNILVYAYDRSSGLKHQRALEILERLVETGGGALSTQVLSEFYAVVTRKLRNPLGASEAAERVEYFLANWTVLDITAATVREALRGVQRYQLPYWDALVWATARVHRVPIILTEDFNTGAILDNVRMINPLDQNANWNFLST